MKQAPACGNNYMILLCMMYFDVVLFQALVEIGDYIQSCLSDFKSEDEGMTSLWVFVSKFTEDSSEELQKLYKRAKKEITVSKQQVSVYVVGS